MRFKNKILIFLLMALQANLCIAKADSIQGNGAQAPVSSPAMDKKEWKELKKKLKIKDYKPAQKEPAKKTKKKGPKLAPDLSPDMRMAIKWGLFALVIGLLLYLVLRVLGINPFIKKGDKNKIHMALEELEDHLDTAAIDPHLYTAIKSKNFKLAIRLYYLMIIQKLALKEKITWKKYKTNKHYLIELRNREEYPILRKLTLTYERSWFGESDINENEYDSIQPDFVNFLQSIR